MNLLSGIQLYNDSCSKLDMSVQMANMRLNMSLNIYISNK